MSKRRVIFRILLCLFMAGVGWWMVYVPYAPQHLYDALPANAAFVTVHRDIAGRWDSFSRNPLTRSLLSSMGTDPYAMDIWADDPVFRKWLGELASDEVVVAYVPSLGRLGERAWVFASWVGGRSQWLRWLAPLSEGDQWQRWERYGGRDIWTFTDASLKGAETISIAFVEGMILGCICDDPGAMRNVLDTLDGRAPGVTERHPELVDNVACAGPPAADRGWIRSVQDGSALPCTYAVTELEQARIRGRFCLATDAPDDTDWVSRLDVNGLGRVFGDLPLAVLGVSRGTLVSWLGDEENVRGGDLFAEGVNSLEGCEAGVLCILGGEYSGRLKGVKWPGLVLGVQVARAEDALAAVSRLMDRLNARYRWGLIAQEVAVGDRGMYAIESTADTSYAELPPGERLAYAVCGNWLLLSSNEETLASLVARYDRSESLEEAGRGRWRQGLPTDPCSGHGWIDLDGGGKVLRLALTAYSVKLFADDPARTQAKRQRLNEAKAWIDALAPLRACRLWLESANGDMSIRFEMGDEGENTQGATVTAQRSSVR